MCDPKNTSSFYWFVLKVYYVNICYDDNNIFPTARVVGNGVMNSIGRWGGESVVFKNSSVVTLKTRASAPLRLLAIIKLRIFRKLLLMLSHFLLALATKTQLSSYLPQFFCEM